MGESKTGRDEAELREWLDEPCPVPDHEYDLSRGECWRCISELLRAARESGEAAGRREAFEEMRLKLVHALLPAQPKEGASR